MIHTRKLWIITFFLLNKPRYRPNERYFVGYQRSIFGTYYPMEPSRYQGISLFHTPHQLTLHALTTSQAWTLSISPHYDWTHYTFTWSYNHGLRYYEDGLLSLQTRIFRNVSSSPRSNFYFDIADVGTYDKMYTFISRMKTWNKDLMVDEIQSDFREGEIHVLASLLLSLSSLSSLGFR